MSNAEPSADHLADAVMARISSRQRRRTRLARIGVSVLLVSTSLGTVAGVWAIAAQPYAQEYAVHCYEAARADAPSTLVVHPEVDGVPVEGDRVQRALDVCTGIVPGTDATELSPAALVACERLDRTVAVFPRQDAVSGRAVCEVVGLKYLGG